MAYKILMDSQMQQGSTDDGYFYCDLEIRNILNEKKLMKIWNYITNE